jgi:alkylhydroperoxidase family enzyme
VGEDKLSQIGNYAESPLFSDRERVALRYADAITWDPASADDALWAELRRHFSEPELVELGFLIGVLCGGQRWIHTLNIQHGEVSAVSTTGYRPELTGNKVEVS